MDKGTTIKNGGYLIKSPPENKMNRGFFKSQWKRRYFVLEETVSSHMRQSASLVYYKDDKCRDKKGTIDLEHCDEVLSSLESAIYPHLFGIKTVHKKGSRTYYLAAPNEQDMTKWVDSLCTVLGLRENNDPPTPPLRPEMSLEDLSTLSINVQSRSANNYVVDTTDDGVAPDLPPQREHKPPPLPPPHAHAAKEEYIPLDTCFSGDVQDDDMVINSIPIDMPPPPPVKTGERYDIAPSGDETYDQPSKSYKPQVSQVDDNDNVYKLPPSSHPSVLHSEPPEESRGSMYKVPPSRNQQVFNKVPPPRSNQFIGSGSDRDDDLYKVPPHRAEQVEYDTPPPTKPIISSRSGTRQAHPGVCDSERGSMEQGHNGVPFGTSDEVYDIPPQKSLLNFVPPPPQPHKGPDNRYMNLPVGQSPLPSPYKATEKSYDFPVSGGNALCKKPSDSEMLVMSPPPPPGDHKANAVVHKYTNAPPGYVPAERDSYMAMKGAGVEVRDSYMPMDGSAQRDSYMAMAQDNRDSSYLPMEKQVPPPVPPTARQLDYQNMDSQQDSYTPIADQQRNAYLENENRHSDIYSSPPSNRPVSDDVYSLPPSNRPVENTVFSSVRDSEIYSTSPSNKKVAQASLLDACPPAPGQTRDSTYDTPPPRPYQSKRNITNSPRFKLKAEKVPPPSFNVERSRSFKRNVSPPKADILLPKRKSRSESSSSSDDEVSAESRSLSSHDRSLESIPPKLQQNQSLKESLHRIPPPPLTAKKSNQLQYLELDLNSDKHDSDAEKSPAASAKSPARTVLTSDSIDYREIDFVRTDALSATKRELESNREK